MRIKKWTLAGCLLFGLSSYANAGLYSDDLAKCMVISLDDSDKHTIQTMSLQAILAHPNFAQKNPYSAYEMSQTKRQMGALLTKIFAKDCLGEFLLTVHYDGEEAMANSMRVLGEYAFAEIGNHPSVKAYGTDLVNYVDKRQFEQAVKQAFEQAQK